MNQRLKKFASAILRACGVVTPRERIPDVWRIYKEAARNEIRNPVVVIHGILGARLEQRSTGRVVWGAFTADRVDAKTPQGARTATLPLRPPASAYDYDPSQEDVFARGPLKEMQVSILSRVHSIKVYADIIRTLGAGGYRDELFAGTYASDDYADDFYSCFSFCYDWRRDNVENAIQLGRFLREKRKEIEMTAPTRVQRLRAEGGRENNARADRIEQWLAEGYRFDVVAHSMGGLIARYFLRYGATDLPADGAPPEVTWAGASEIERLVLVATPNLGSMGALEHLLDGFRPARFLPHFAAAVLGTFPAIYQLLPRPRHTLLRSATGEPNQLDFLESAVWEANGWGLLDPEVDDFLKKILPDARSVDERRDQARTYVRWCLKRARQFHDALDSKVPSRCPTEMTLFAADAQPTLWLARLENNGGRLLPTFVGDDLSTTMGDGIVARYSAIGDDREDGSTDFWVEPPEPWTRVIFLSDDHIGLTRNPHFVNNLLFHLLQCQPRREP